ncbi:phosphatidylglycerophosphatase A [Patescibacteria group bacterium]
MYEKLCFFVASTFYSGFIPEKVFGQPGRGAGLIASLVALLLQFYFLYAAWPLLVVVVLMIDVFVIGLLVMTPAEQYMRDNYGSRVRHDGKEVDEDFNELSIDEVPGQFCAGLPVFMFDLSFGYSAVLLVLSFILFRIFDVVKPWPVSWFEEKLPSPFSVMLDDVAAGIMSAIIILLMIQII